MTSQAFLIGNGQMHLITGEMGETPPCPEAKFVRGEVVRIRRNKTVGHFPSELIVLSVVPPGFSPDDALADLRGKARPLMKQVGYNVVAYILCERNGEGPYLCREKDVLSSTKEFVDIGVVSSAVE